MPPQPVVEIVSAQVVVARGGQDLESAFDKPDERDIEGAASEVINEDSACLTALVESVRERGCCGLVDNTLDFEARYFASILRCLPLGIGEVGRDGDDSFVDYEAQGG